MRCCARMASSLASAIFLDPSSEDRGQRWRLETVRHALDTAGVAAAFGIVKMQIADSRVAELALNLRCHRLTGAKLCGHHHVLGVVGAHCDVPQSYIRRNLTGSKIRWVRAD